MTSATTFTILYQEPDGDGYVVESVGSGVITNNGTKIDVTYRVTDTNSGNIDTCTSTWVQ